MTGHNDRDWILAIGCAHCPHRLGIAQGIGNVLIRYHLAIGNCKELRPDCLLELRTMHGERYVKLTPFVGEVLDQLPMRIIQDGVGDGIYTTLLDEKDGCQRLLCSA